MPVDSHCHLDYEIFESDRHEMMQRAIDNSVSYMVTIGVELDKMPDVIKIAKEHQNIFATAGIHPHHVLEAPDDAYQQLVSYAQHSKVIGLGETGLDYFYNKTGHDCQEKLFREHITIAREFDLPVIVHTRDAQEDTIRILADEKNKGDFRILIHCFSGDKKFAYECLDLGAYLSVSGIITFKNSQELRDAIAAAPLDRLLVETDSPYLAPLPFRGKRNEPSFVRYNLEAVATLHGISYKDADEQTTDNFFHLFSKAQHITGYKGL